MSTDKQISVLLLVSILIFCLPAIASTYSTVSKTVSQVLNSIRHVVGNLQDYVGDRDGCTFRCPDGSRPRARTNHVQTSNGCGTFGVNLESYVKIPGLTSCCNKHDVCYDTCLNDKDKCDKIFKDCLHKVCKSAKKVMTKDMYNGCNSAVDMIYASTVALGCKPFKEAQQKACTCRGQTNWRTEL